MRVTFGGIGQHGIEFQPVAQSSYQPSESVVAPPPRISLYAAAGLEDTRLLS